MHLTVNLADVDGKQPSEEPARLSELAAKISLFRKRKEKCRAEIRKHCFEGWKCNARVARRKAYEQMLAG